MIHAIYARVSTEDQARHGYSLPSQIGACRQVLPADADEVLEFVDDGISGASTERPALSRLRDLVRTSPVAVVCLDPDRLSRNLIQLLVLTDELGRSRPVQFVSMQWEDTPEGRLFLSMRGAVAEFERSKIRERTVRGRRQKAEQGEIACAPHEVYGYDYDDTTGSLRVGREEADVVRRIFQLYMEGYGTPTIADILNSDGVPTKHGLLWRQGGVYRILRNPVYGGSLRQFASSDRPLLLSVEPVVDPAVFSLTRARMAQRAGTQGRSGARPVLLGGLLWCGLCGGRFYVRHSRDGTRDHHTWYYCKRRWRTATLPGERLCEAPTHRADRLDATVWEAVAELVRAPGAWPALVDPGAERGDRLQAVRQDLMRLRGGRRNALALVASGAARLEELESLIKSGQRRISGLEAEERRLVASGAAGAQALQAWAERLAVDVLAAMDAGSLETRRRVLRTMVAAVLVHPDGSVILRPQGLEGGA